MSLPSFPLRSLRRAHSFTLIELMVVMAVIAILSAITLGAMQYAQNSAGRSRATSEIAAFEAGLERYKIDNGVYPATNVFSGAGIVPITTNSTGSGIISGFRYRTLHLIGTTRASRASFQSSCFTFTSAA